MTSGGFVAGYAPYGLRPDAGSWSFVESRVSSPLGTAVLHSRKTSRSRRATIFLHGAAGSWTTWTPLIEAAENAGVSIPNPILLDLPGWGDAQLTAAGSDSMLEALCSLVRAGAEALGYTEWDLIGHSMGGFVGLHMAAIWPECVLSVATISATSWSIMETAAHPVRRFFVQPGFVGLWRGMQAMSHLGRFGSGLARRLDRLHLLRGATAPLFRHPRRIANNVISALGAEVRPASFDAAVRMGEGYDATVRWAVIDCPVRAVLGDRDVFSRPLDLERLAEILPDSYRETIDDCGHFAQIERPYQVLEAFGYLHAIP
jgi:pimeloyl-ACP methyl ester carboxylesterase